MSPSASVRNARVVHVHALGALVVFDELDIRGEASSLADVFESDDEDGDGVSPADGVLCVFLVVGIHVMIAGFDGIHAGSI